jgi:glycosyltransferase involved in cell wall biosynthesis
MADSRREVGGGSATAAPAREAGWGSATAAPAREVGGGHEPDLSVRSPALRVAVVGMSVGPTCGARDHALLLAEGLSREQVSCSRHWLERREKSVRGGGAEIRAWGQALAGELARERPDAILLHYSVFAFSHRGLPLFVAPVLAVLRRSGIPVVAVLHEYAYPWRHGGLRGKVWAITQRALLIDVVSSSAAVLLTTDFRVRWLESRPWLPRRPAAFAPVFSNLPSPAGGLSAGLSATPPDSSGSHRDRSHVPPASESSTHRAQPVIGLFGYSYQGAALSLVLDAIALLAKRGVEPRLVLLGAPGRTAAVAETWRRQARARAVEHALEFSDTLPAQDLSDALAACELLLFVDAAGPSSRKGTLAASLASGRPVLAIDGPRRWLELVWAEAAAVVEPTAPALADAMGELLGDDAVREALGARGRAFAEERMGVARTAEAVGKLLDGIVGVNAPSRFVPELARATP